MASRGASSKQKRLRWAHVTNKEVQGAVSGLLENTVVVLPETCVLSAGLEPNINDKNQHKKLVRLCPCPCPGSMPPRSRGGDGVADSLAVADGGTVAVARQAQAAAVPADSQDAGGGGESR